MRVDSGNHQFAPGLHPGWNTSRHRWWTLSAHPRPPPANLNPQPKYMRVYGVGVKGSVTVLLYCRFYCECVLGRAQFYSARAKSGSAQARLGGWGDTTRRPLWPSAPPGRRGRGKTPRHKYSGAPAYPCEIFETLTGTQKARGEGGRGKGGTIRLVVGGGCLWHLRAEDAHGTSTHSHMHQAH